MSSNRRTKRKRQTKLKKRTRAKNTFLRQWELVKARAIVMARLARKIGRGHDAIYHGTRHPVEVLRSGKLKPSNDGAVYFTRSPEEAARCANLEGRKLDDHSPGLLVLNRASLSQTYRLTPSRYREDWLDEREEHVWDRKVSFRRHLLGVVRDADVTKILGPPDFRYLDEFEALPKAQRLGHIRKRAEAVRKLREGRAEVRRLIIRERKQRIGQIRPVPFRPKKAQRATQSAQR